jgi:oxygen-independent coproporphyrinogen-3 oxidase
MDNSVVFDEELIRRYDQAGPRYTSYPTALQFDEAIGEPEYRRLAEASNIGEARPISIYIHIPFCDTVCYYCGCNKVVTKNRDKAVPYMDHLKQEIIMQGDLFDYQRKVEQLHWGGGTPTFLSHEQMTDLMNCTAEHFTLLDDDSGEYSIEIDPREVTPETIRVLRDLRFNRLSLGVQDFDPRVQKAVNRVQSEEQTWQALTAARDSGFRSISVDLIYGLPLQTVDSFASTLDKVIDAGPDRLSVFNYAHLPKLFKPQRRINEADLPSAAEKLGIMQMTIERLQQAGYVYIGMDHFARPDDELTLAQQNGTLHRNFQGYATHADSDLVAMGITGIGNIGNSYSQNVKTLDEYYQHIDSGVLPVFRGMLLDFDDLLRREVIMQLICQFRLEFAPVEARFKIDFGEYFADELQALQLMQDDGLLTISDKSIEVQPVGRLLIRNICMIFDRYLEEQPAQRFSRVI